MSQESFIPYQPEQLDVSASVSRSSLFLEQMERRRSVREISGRPVDKEIIRNIIQAASTAPSGANKQPWTFCSISNAELKHEIRAAAEKEEQINYSSRMSEEWLSDLKQFGTNWQKPFLETAPWLIVVFSKSYDLDSHGNKSNNYYVKESVGLACGLLITAIHHAGLCALTHTPSPMDFLSKILKRPRNERPFLLIPVGYPADDCSVPDIKRKSLELVSAWYE